MSPFDAPQFSFYGESKRKSLLRNLGQVVPRSLGWFPLLRRPGFEGWRNDCSETKEPLVDLAPCIGRNCRVDRERQASFLIPFLHASLSATTSLVVMNPRKIHT